MIESKEQGQANVALFVKSKTRIDEIVLRSSYLQGVEESNDSTPKKYIYTIPFDQQEKIPSLLKELEDSFNHIYIDIEMNSLEDAYVKIAKAEE